MAVTVINRQKFIKISPKKIEKFASLILTKYNSEDSQLNILITDNPEIKKLNKKFLGKNSATDVLTFGADCNAAMADIAVSAQEAVIRCGEFHSSAADELKLYLAHGILHFLGYDDTERPEKMKMRKNESKIMKWLCKIEIY